MTSSQPQKDEQQNDDESLSPFTSSLFSKPPKPAQRNEEEEEEEAEEREAEEKERPGSMMFDGIGIGSCDSVLDPVDFGQDLGFSTTTRKQSLVSFLPLFFLFLSFRSLIIYKQPKAPIAKKGNTNRGAPTESVSFICCFFCLILFLYLYLYLLFVFFLFYSFCSFCSFVFIFDVHPCKTETQRDLQSRREHSNN